MWQTLKSLRSRPDTVLPEPALELQAVVDRARQEKDELLAVVADVEARIARVTDKQKALNDAEHAFDNLAEQAAGKAKALESQKAMVDRAVVSANLLNEMVRAIEAHTSKLQEGHAKLMQAEQLLERTGAASSELAAQVSATTMVRDDLAREMIRLQQDSASLVEFGRGYMERLSLFKKDSNVLEQRLHSIQGAIADSEARTDALAARDRNLGAIDQRVGAAHKRHLEFLAQSDQLVKKQAQLEGLRSKLAHVDELARKTTAQMKALNALQQDVTALQKDFSTVSTSFADVARLRDRLQADRVALEAVGDRMTAFRAGAPEIEQKLDLVLSRVDTVDRCADVAAHIDELRADLDRQISRLHARRTFVETVEDRVNGLSAVASDTEKKLGAQLARRAELETLSTAVDAVTALVEDTQHKLASVSDAQNKLLPMIGQVATIEDDIEDVHARVKDAQQESDVIARHERRLVELIDRGQRLAGDVDERLGQAQSLADTVARTVVVKDELTEKLTSIRASQDGVVARVEAIDEQIVRVEAMLGRLDARRADLALVEQAIAQFDSRITALAGQADVVEQKMTDLARREHVIASVRADARAVEELASRTRVDLDGVLEAVRTERLGARPAGTGPEATGADS